MEAIWKRWDRSDRMLANVVRAILSAADDNLRQAMTTDDEAIASAEVALASAQATEAEVRAKFIAQAGPWLAASWTATVEKAVREQHERSQALGREGLGELKRELTELVSTSDDTAHAYLDRPEVWAVGHGRPLQGNRVSGPIDEALRAAIALPAPLLEERGYAHDFERKADGWRYRYGLQIGDELKATLSRLNLVRDESESAARALREAQTAKAESEAGDLWGSV